jgi:predicted GIY-YIG superfamily endonuclease
LFENTLELSLYFRLFGTVLLFLSQNRVRSLFIIHHYYTNLIIVNDIDFVRENFEVRRWMLQLCHLRALRRSPKPTTMVFACYLLTPRGFKRRAATFMGTTVDPERSLREHNGEEGDGVEATLAHRPWEMVCVLHGFQDEFEALECESSCSESHSYAALTRHCF